jgi:hypothetical protein
LERGFDEAPFLDNICENIKYEKIMFHVIIYK